MLLQFEELFLGCVVADVAGDKGLGYRGILRKCRSKNFVLRGTAFQ